MASKVDGPVHFHHLFEIDTHTFAGTRPRPDAVNEMIGGDEMAQWLRAKLVEAGYACSNVVAEDHGWDFGVTAERRRYLVVCSCDLLDEEMPANFHAVQVAQTKGEPTLPDPLLWDVRAILEANDAFTIASDEPARRRG